MKLLERTQVFIDNSSCPSCLDYFTLELFFDELAQHPFILMLLPASGGFTTEGYLHLSDAQAALDS